MDSKFKPYRTGMMTVKEKYVCGREDRPMGRNHVYYLCRCDCGKEVIFSGDEISRHPYSCGCTPKPENDNKKNENSHGLKDGTMLCMLRPTRAVYSNCTSGISGVSYEKKREKWRAQIVLKGKNHFLGYFDKKEDAIKARIEGERKYWEPLLVKKDADVDNNSKERKEEENGK